MFLNFNSNICRVCLCLINNNNNKKIEYKIVDNFNYVTLLEFSKHDRLPQSICSKCANCLEIAAKIKRTAIKNEMKLNSILEKAHKNFAKENNFKHITTGEVIDDLEQLTALLPIHEINEVNRVIKELEPNKQMNSSITKTLHVQPLKTFSNEEDQNDINDDSFENELFNSSGEDDDNSGTKTVKKKIKINNSNIKNKLHKTQIRNFKDEWLNMFKPWLTKKNSRAYCTYCGMHLTNILGHVQRHQNTMKHLYTTQLCSLDPKTKETEDGTVPQYKCSFCNRLYLSSEKLLGHLKFHERGGTFNYKCALCTKKFRLKENLKEHLRMHVSHKASYKCLKCKHKFPRNQTLHQHMLKCDETILTDYKQCKNCTETFDNFDSFYYHMNKMHDDIDENCWICDKNIKTEKEMKDHLMEHDIIKL